MVDTNTKLNAYLGYYRLIIINVGKLQLGIQSRADDLTVRGVCARWSENARAKAPDLFLLLTLRLQFLINEINYVNASYPKEQPYPPARFFSCH